MEPIFPVQIVEQFHLLFLTHLTRGSDKRTVVVKGGCNLRFFHRSIRYSEDMDLDVDGMDAHVLRDRIRGILTSRPFNQVLESRGIAMEHITEHRDPLEDNDGRSCLLTGPYGRPTPAPCDDGSPTGPKQTSTVQRWKFGLQVERVAKPFPTKIEFSRRGIDDGVEFSSPSPGLIVEHRLTPFMASHYGASTALRQKVGALARRTQTQARDIFDLHHLIAGGASLEALRFLDSEVLDLARARATDVDFGVFKSQVLSYLRVEDRDRFDSPDVWDTLVLEVVDALGPAGS